MGIIKGLKDVTDFYQKEDEKQQANSQAKQDYVKIPYLQLTDGETVQLRFLQELDEDSPGYNKEADIGFVAVEHAPAANWKRRGLCSIETGKCYGCEQHKVDYMAGWKQKSKLYINVLVKRAGEEEKVYVLSQGNGPKSITPWLLEYAGDAGTITGQSFKMKRKGSGQKDTEYTLVPGKFDETPYDVTQHEIFDLYKCVRDIPYENQAVYYGVSSGVTTQDETSEGNATKVEVDW